MRFLLAANGVLVPCPNCVDDMKALHAMPANALEKFGSELGRATQQTFMNFKCELDGVESKVLRACLHASETFAQSRSGWLIIHGRSGNGKSHLAAATRNHLVQILGTPTIYITVPDLFYKLRRTFSRDSSNEISEFEDLLDIYRKAPVLILDDLGSERMSDWAAETLFSILDYRYRLRLPTMITSNLNPYDVHDFDVRLVTRMTDKELCQVLENTSPNFRSRERT